MALPDLIARCRQHALTAWEADFVADMERRGALRPPTSRQRATLERIAEGSPDFAEIGRVALTRIEDIVAQWLPGGKRLGRDWVARNPKRANDTRPGSFRITLDNGRWIDFASRDAGGDVISLAAYLFDLSQAEAARRIGDMLGISGASRG